MNRGDRRAAWACAALVWTIPLAAWLAPKAEAAPLSVEQYVAINGENVCTVLDAYPSFAGILGIGDSLVQSGNYSYYQAGQIERLSITVFCPRHTRLMDLFVQTYGSPNTYVAAAPGGSAGRVGGAIA